MQLSNQNPSPVQQSSHNPPIGSSPFNSTAIAKIREHHLRSNGGAAARPKVNRRTAKFHGGKSLGRGFDKAPVAKPRTSTLEAFLSESIILDIIRGTKLVPKPRERVSERSRTSR